MHRAIITALIFCLFLGTAFSQQGGKELRFRLGALDPERDARAVLDQNLLLGSRPDQGQGFYVVQFEEKIRPVDRTYLKEAGARIYSYVPDDGLAVKIEHARVQNLEQSMRIRAILPFHPALKVEPGLLEGVSEEEGNYVINLFPGERLDVALDLARGLGGQAGSQGLDRFEIRATPEQLREILLSNESIQWISPASEATLRNDRTAWVIQTNVSNFTKVWDNGILGDNQIVGHIDDPLDLGNCYLEDPSEPNAGPSHRKVIYHDGTPATWGDHGVHTAATAAGDQEPINGSTFRNGIAYRAKIAHVDLGRVSSTNLDVKFQDMFNQGARMFTNSWGNDGTTSYDNWARDIDLFSRNNEDALCMWAVTNLSSLKNPENAKNCLAVGGTFQTPSQESHCTGGDGPTNDGRRKPEIYTPGCSIVSANAGTSCGTQSMSGTSMACPAVTGAAALTRQYFEDGFYPTGASVVADGFTPSGALVKAVLINGADDMSGVSGYPSNREGWGHAILDRSLHFNGDSRKLWVRDVRHASGFSGSGSTRTYAFYVNSSTPSLEITLAFTDQPGALFSNPATVNNLDLRVTEPGGSVYLGNRFSSGQSSTGGSADSLNNVERVRRNAPAVGWWTIEVEATNVPTPNQGFALAVSGDISPCGTFTNYGTGLAGTGGQVPSLDGGGTPVIGAPVSLDVTNGLGNAFGYLFLGVGRANLPAFGGEILVGTPWQLFPLPLNGSGSASLAGNLANDNSFVGVELNFQGLYFDPGAVNGVSMTNGLEMCIGGN